MIIYAVDDEPILLDQLKKTILEAAPNAELYSFSSATQLLSEIEKNTPLPEVAFLDIELPGMSGIELAKQIKTKSPKTWIVFVTGFSQYAVKAYEIHARGYIMKPVTADRIRAELDAPCTVPLEKIKGSVIMVKCFGHFEAFVDDKPIKFNRSKTKELFAYLIDRNGAAVNTATLCSMLWEDQPDSAAHHNYLRKLVTDLTKTLVTVGARDVLLKSRNSFAVDISKIDCDYYRFLKRDPSAVNAYNGEYMSQYSWSEFTLGNLL